MNQQRLAQRIGQLPPVSGPAAPGTGLRTRGMEFIRDAVIHGSRARGEHHPGSDIELAVYPATLTPEVFSMLCSDIDALPNAFKLELLHFQILSNPALKK